MLRLVRLSSKSLHNEAISRPLLKSREPADISVRLIYLGKWKLHFLDDVRQVETLDKKLVALDEADLEEKHVRGWGSGGQKTNKTANCVILTHNPTGLTVKVHASRSLVDNMKIARARLRMKLDIHVRGEESILRQEEQRISLKKSAKTAKAKNNLVLKKKLKGILDTDNEDDKLY